MELYLEWITKDFFLLSDPLSLFDILSLFLNFYEALELSILILLLACYDSFCLTLYFSIYATASWNCSNFYSGFWVPPSSLACTFSWGLFPISYSFLPLLIDLLNPLLCSDLWLKSLMLYFYSILTEDSFADRSDAGTWIFLLEGTASEGGYPSTNILVVFATEFWSSGASGYYHWIERSTFLKAF